MSKLSVLHLVPTYLPAYRYGGPIISVHELNKWLVKSDVDVTVYTTNVDGENNLEVPIGKPQLVDGVTVYYFPSSFPRSWFYSKDMSKALAKNIASFNLVHITSVFLSASFLGAKFSKKFNKPYIISPRGSLIPELINKKNSFIKKCYIKLIERQNLLSASAIHFTTKYEEDKYQELNLPLSKSIIIPNGVELNLAKSNLSKENFCKKFRIPSKAKIVLSLGRLNWKKGFDTLIPAFAEVAKKDSEALLLIVGDDGDEPGYSYKLKDMAYENGLRIGENIRFIGDLRGENKLAAYRSADVFVMASYSENFGISAVEAMSLGLAVVVTDTVGVANDIKPANAGMVIQKNKEQLMKALIGLLRDKALCGALGERGRKLAQERYSWPVITEQWLKEYKKLL